MYTRRVLYFHTSRMRVRGKGPIVVGTRNYSRRRLLSALFALRECSWLAVSSRILLRWLAVCWILEDRLLVLASDSPTSNSHTCAHMYHRIANIEHVAMVSRSSGHETMCTTAGVGRPVYLFWRPDQSSRIVCLRFGGGYCSSLLYRKRQREGVSVPKPELRAPLPSRLYLAPCRAFGEKISLVAEEFIPLSR